MHTLHTTTLVIPLTRLALRAYNPGMTRVTHHLTDAQLAWLNREAKKLGITVADLLRRIIDEKRESK